MNAIFRAVLSALLMVACGSAITIVADEPVAGKPFAIHIVDADTGRGVPLVELKTVNQVTFITDSNGVVAFDEPGLRNRRVFFHIKSHGYEFPKDGFGYRGKALQVTPGGTARLKIRRVNLAERLYRITGGGLYRDTLLVGRKPPLKQPVLNGLVLGQDSVLNAVYGGKIHWFWGDTNRPSYPLGNFHVPGATSELPAKNGLSPGRGVDLTYFVDKNGFAKPTAKMPGPGPTWLSGLIVLKDKTGRESLFANYVKIKPPLTVYERGLVQWNKEMQQFDHVSRFPQAAAAYPGGHPFLHQDGGVEYVYYCHPYPLLRVRADVDSLKDLSQYEAFTCLKAGNRFEKPEIDRDTDGRVRWAWKRNTPFLNQQQQAKLLSRGLLKPHETLLPLRDAVTGKTVLAHGGSVYWNAFRKRWVMIAVQSFGTSYLGEVWYAEADTPIGPWVYAVKIVTHDKYSFYNPKQHPMFDDRGGRTIYFEGTYTTTFSGNTVATPRYDYNQIMYRLKLDDPRTVLPVPVTATNKGASPYHTGTPSGAVNDWNRISFFAPDRPGVGTIPIFVGNRMRLVTAEPAKKDTPAVFHALPATTKSPPATTVPLWEFHNRTTGDYRYSVDADWKLAGFERAGQPVCRVWKNPLQPK